MSAHHDAAPDSRDWSARHRSPLIAWEWSLWRMKQDEPMPGEPGYDDAPADIACDTDDPNHRPPKRRDDGRPPEKLPDFMRPAPLPVEPPVKAPDGIGADEATALDLPA